MIAYYLLLEVCPCAVILVVNRAIPPRIVRARSLNAGPSYSPARESTALLQPT